MKLRNCVNRPAQNLKLTTLLDIMMGMRKLEVTLSLPNTAIFLAWNLIVHGASVFKDYTESFGDNLVLSFCLALIRPLLYFRAVVQ